MLYWQSIGATNIKLVHRMDGERKSQGIADTTDTAPQKNMRVYYYLERDYAIFFLSVWRRRGNIIFRHCHLVVE